MSRRKSKSPPPTPAEEAAETAAAAEPALDEAAEPKLAAEGESAGSPEVTAPEGAHEATAFEDDANQATAPPEAESQAAQDAAADEERPRAELKRAIEALIFVADKAVTAQQLARFVKLKLADARVLITELMQDYSERGIELAEVGGGYLFRSAPACADYVRSLAAQRPVRLTRAQLETLALVAYRQPITRPEIDEVRGVDTGSAVRVLLERGLIKMLGRKDEPGRPLLYGTSPYFLEFFGMNSLKDLPTLREFTELSDEHRELFQRKTGEAVEEVEAQLAALAAEAEAEAEAQLGDEDLGENDEEEVEAGAAEPSGEDAADEGDEDGANDADEDDADEDDEDQDQDERDDGDERAPPIDP